MLYLLNLAFSLLNFNFDCVRRNREIKKSNHQRNSLNNLRLQIQFNTWGQGLLQSLNLRMKKC